MKKLDKLLREISQLTLNIETNYPELYRFLDENPITIPSVEHPAMDASTFNNYLESLKKLLFHHIQQHKSVGLKTDNQENVPKLRTELAKLSRIVRERTLRRFGQLPDGFHNWKLNATAMSFADIANHLVNVDRLFLEMLGSESKKYVWVLGTDEPHLHLDESGFSKLLEELNDLQTQREHAIDNLTESVLKQEVLEEGGEKMSLWWFIMRNLIEHEVYHRGQMSIYLKILKGEDY